LINESYLLVQKARKENVLSIDISGDSFVEDFYINNPEYGKGE